jgi:hypothetical protein
VTVAGQRDRRLCLEGLYRTRKARSDDEVAHIRLFGDGRFRAYRTADGFQRDRPDIEGVHRVEMNDLVFAANGDTLGQHAVMTSASEFTWELFPGLRFQRVK